MHLPNCRFASIIRTQGKRVSLLEEALQSVSFQNPSCMAIVVLHGKFEKLALVESICRRIDHLKYTLLHAEDLHKKRGYPLNVGLKYLYEHSDVYERVGFLDDDDIYYPFFTQCMDQAFCLTGADVVYSASNKRFPDGLPVHGYGPDHIGFLPIENFIPINSYSVQTKILKEMNIFFDEELEYMEDWHFLLQLFSRGLRFEAIPERLSEFRIISDGNTPQKKQPEKWKQASLKIRRFINHSQFSLSGFELISLLTEHNSQLFLKDSGDSLGVYKDRETGKVDAGPGNPSILRSIWNGLPLFAKIYMKKTFEACLRKAEKFQNQK